MVNALEKQMRDEIATLRMLLEAPGTRVHIHVVACRGDQGDVVFTVSEGTTRGEAAAIAASLRREANRIDALLVGKAGAA